MGFDILRGRDGDKRAHLGDIDGQAVPRGLLDRAFRNAELRVWHGSQRGNGRRTRDDVKSEKDERGCENQFGILFSDDGITSCKADRRTVQNADVVYNRGQQSQTKESYTMRCMGWSRIV